MTDEIRLPISGRPVYALVSEMAFATKIAKAVNSFHLKVRNFDRAEALISNAAQEGPCLIILDWDSREAESYKVLKEVKERPGLQSTAVVGFVAAGKRDVGREAETAGCLRVYFKTDFLKNLNDLIMRFAK